MSNFVAQSDGSNLAHRHRIFTNPTDFTSYLAVNGEVFFLLCDGNLFIAVGNGVCPGGVARARLYNSDIPLQQTPDAGATSELEAQQVIDAIVESEELQAALAEALGVGEDGPAGDQSQVVSYDENGEKISEYIQLRNIITPDEVNALPEDLSQQYLVSFSRTDPESSTSPHTVQLVSGPAPGVPAYSQLTNNDISTTYTYLRGDTPPSGTPGLDFLPEAGDDILVNVGWANELVNSRLTAEQRAAIDAIEVPTDEEIGAATAEEIGMKLKELLTALQS